MHQDALLDESDQLQPEGLPDFLRDPLDIARRRRLPMAFALAVGLVATAIVIYLIPPRYLAQATVLLTTQQIPPDLVRTTVVDDALQRLNAMLGEILSRENLAQVVDKFGLYEDLRDELTLGEIVERARADIHIELKPGISSRNDRSAGRLFGISFEAHHPDRAAAVANHIAGMFTNESFRVRSQQAQLTVEFLRTELNRTETGLRQQNRAVTEFRERYRGELPEDLASNLARLEWFKQQRQSLNLEIHQAEARLGLLELHGAEGGSLETGLATLQASLQRELALHTEEHPNVIALRRQIENFDTALAASSSGATTAQQGRRVLVAAAERTLRDLKERASRIDRDMEMLDARVGRTPARDEALSALLEHETVLRDRYVEFLRKVEAAELGQSLEAAQQGERISILDRAEPPSAPTRERWRYLLGGVVASVLFAFGVAIILEIVDPLVLAPSSPGLFMGLSVLGHAPRLH